MLSWSMLEGGLAGNIISRQAPEVVVRDEKAVAGEGAGVTRMEKKKSSTRRPGARLAGAKSTVPRETVQSVSVAARRDINPSAALIRSAACVGVKAICRRSAPTSSRFSRARTRRALTTKVARPSAARKRRPSYVTCQENITISRMMKGDALRSLGKWRISRSYAIVGHRVTCLTHQPE